MEKSYFASLNITDKIEFIWNYGEIIAETETPDHYISLFLLGKFYLEVYLDKNSDDINRIDIQTDDEILYGYIKNISLDNLTNWIAN